MDENSNYKYSLGLISECPTNKMIDEHNIERLNKREISPDSILTPDDIFEREEFEIITKWNHYYNKDMQIQKKYICAVTEIETINPYTVSTVKSYTSYISDLFSCRSHDDALYTQWDNPMQGMRFNSKDEAYKVLKRNIWVDPFKRSGLFHNTTYKKVVGVVKPIYESHYLRLLGQQFLYLNLKDIMKASLEHKENK